MQQVRRHGFHVDSCCAIRTSQALVGQDLPLPANLPQIVQKPKTCLGKECNTSHVNFRPVVGVWISRSQTVWQ
jgi:hypothetical protein